MEQAPSPVFWHSVDDSHTIKQKLTVGGSTVSKGSSPILVWRYEWHRAPGPAAFLWGTQQRRGGLRSPAESERQVAGQPRRCLRSPPSSLSISALFYNHISQTQADPSTCGPLVSAPRGRLGVSLWKPSWHPVSSLISWWLAAFWVPS